MEYSTVLGFLLVFGLMSVSALASLKLARALSPTTGILLAPAMWLALSGLAVTCITEGLSLLHALGPSPAFSVWIIFLLVGIVYSIKDTASELKPIINSFLPQSRLEFFITASLLILLAVSLFLAIASPPNNADAIGYHNARVLHWAAQKSVAHFFTTDLRQVRMPPLASYLRLHALLLTGADSLFNLTQWFAYWISLMIAALLGWELSRGDRRVAALSALFVATIPMAVLQASSSQNDLTLGAFLLGASLVLVRIKRSSPEAPQLFILFWTLLGLASLTKGTAYIMDALLILSSVPDHLRLLKKPIRSRITPALLGFLIAMSCNLPHLYRNYTFFHGQTPNAEVVPLHAWYEDGLKMGGKRALDQVFRTVLLEFDFLKKVPGAKDRIENLQVVFERKLELPDFDPKIHLNQSSGFHYFLEAPLPDEDYAGCALHWILALLSLAVGIGLYLKNPLSQLSTQLLLSAVISGLAIAIEVKWMPWNNRLLLPVVMLMVAPAIDILSRRRFFRSLLIPFSVVASLYALPFLLMDYSHPLLGRAGVRPFFENSRWTNYFRGNNQLQSSVESILHAIAQTCGSSASPTVGLTPDTSKYEYYFWAGARYYRIPLNFETTQSTETPPNLCEMIYYCSEEKGFSFKSCSL